MSVQKLPSGRWRAQVYDPNAITKTGKQGANVSVSKVLPDEPGTYRTKTEAKQARARARERLGAARIGEVTVAQWRDRWLSDPLFERPKQSTMMHNAERTKAFADKYGDLAVDAVSDFIVAQWLAGGKRNGTVMALRAMFNDAASKKAGRLITVNPFAELGLERTKGNKDKQPPTQEQVESMVLLAHELTPPSFAAWFEFGCTTAIRPGEIDAAQWPWIRWDDGEIDVVEQWSVKVGHFTEPKYGPYTVALFNRTRGVLERMKEDSEQSPFIFTTLRGTHYTPSSRNHHWNRVRAAAGLGNMTLYLATRHYFAWYALNVLELPKEIVAEQLGHKDGGELIEKLYGHPDRKKRLRKLREAYDQATPVRPLRVVGKADDNA